MPYFIWKNMPLRLQTKNIWELKKMIKPDPNILIPKESFLYAARNFIKPLASCYKKSSLKAEEGGDKTFARQNSFGGGAIQFLIKRSLFTVLFNSHSVVKKWLNLFWNNISSWYQAKKVDIQKYNKTWSKGFFPE